MKEIAKDLITGDYQSLNTSYNNILDVLKGEEILRFNNEIKGSIILAAFRSTTFIETVNLTNDDILVFLTLTSPVDDASYLPFLFGSSDTSILPL